MYRTLGTLDHLAALRKGHLPSRSRHRETSRMPHFSLNDVVELLDRHHQRATYGAVAGVLDLPTRFLMGGLPRAPRYSWVVNARTRLPTGYTDEQMHSLLRTRGEVIGSPATLEEWLRLRRGLAEQPPGNRAELAPEW